MNKEQTTEKTGKNRDKGKDVVMGVLGAISAVYLLNPTAGFDFLPDNLPIVGNLDEAAFAAMLIASLSHFGLDVTKIINRFVKKTGSTDKDVIDIDASDASAAKK